MSAPLVVVGIGHDGLAGLSPEARAHVESARVLAGGRRHLDFLPDWQGERIVLDNDVAAFIASIRERYRRKNTVTLASGDPLFFGIGAALLANIPRDDLVFIPHVSSVQLAFARIKQTWHDARIVSLHGRPADALIAAVRAGETKIGVLTDARRHPAAIAGILRQLGAADAYELWVCENLGGADERISRHSPADLHDTTFSPLNIVVLRRTRPPMDRLGSDLPLLGIPELAFSHQSGPRGMITRREVRLLALCYLELRPGDVVWDVGAGSGSVSLEAARLSRELRIFAIERDASACERLRTNLARFGASQVQVVAAEAPAGLAGLPEPDAVFIGGSGGSLAEILDTVAAQLRPGGRVVLNCITLETLSLGWERLGELGLEPEATSVQLAHSRPLGRLHSLEPDNPITILQGRKR